MAIWMDMTNSLHVWQGGVVGIVRAELEIAKNMKAENPDVRFCKFDGVRFVEVKEEELSWLWDTESVGDGYLTAMNRNQKADPAPQVNCTDIAMLCAEHLGLANAYNFSGSRIQRLIWGMKLYANTLPSWAGSLAYRTIKVLSIPLKCISKVYVSCRNFGKKRDNEPGVEAELQVFSHPFTDGDTVFSCGWMTGGKEACFEKVKQLLPNLFLVYLIYDIILIRENTKQFYHPQGNADFKRYLDWASLHCDAIFYGGKTAMEDTQEYQKKNHLPVPPGFPVYFGSDIIRSVAKDDVSCEAFAEKAGIEGDFILAVGSLDERKNYSTLYRAITILADRNKETCPQLVIVGKGNACGDLLNTMKRDPRTKDRIILVAPTDEELDWLYRKAKLSVLASAWEGWSLTLPEALQYNKLTIAADVAPLREAGEPYVVFADTYDPFDWADKISYYLQHPEEVKATEDKLQKEYRCITWKDCGTQIAHLLSQINQTKQMDQSASLWIDLTCSFNAGLSNANITGIVRTELMLAKYFYREFHKVNYFAMHSAWGYIPIDKSVLAEVLMGEDLDKDFNLCREKFSQLAQRFNNASQPQVMQNSQQFQDKENAAWFLISIFSPKTQKKLIAYGKKKKQEMLRGKSDDKIISDLVSSDEPAIAYDVPFQKGDVVFSAGTGSGEAVYDTLLSLKKRIGFRYCAVIYDYTPILLPQVHQEATVEYYYPFLDFTSKMADFIFYGGKTAQNDGIAYQKERNLPVPPSCAVKFGSNIKQRFDEDEISAVEQEMEDAEILKRYGIKGPYIMAVGTMEARKNHETLYRAYLRMLEQYEDVPQMVFCGYPGWNAGDFLTTLSRDDRVKGKILRVSPPDKELDILYRHCEFTVLASLYEGWSLTLPESYWYGKFCLCCDTPALKETAGDLAEYVHCWDEKKWAERIHYYHTHSAELEKREQRIADEWHSISWDECAEGILERLRKELNGVQ